LKTQQLTLVSKVRGYVHQVRNQLPFLLGGNLISDDNRLIFARCLESWVFLLEDLMVRLGFSDSSRDARRNNFVAALLVTDVSETLRYLDSVADALIKASSGCEGFQLPHLQALDGSFVEQRLLSPINVAIYGCLSAVVTSEKASFLAICLQFLRFPRKLEFKSIGLEILALEDYMRTEGELATMGPIDPKITLELSKIIHGWFHRFEITDLKPSHGPGSVFEGPLSLTEKFERLGCDKTMQMVLRNHSFPSSYLSFYPLSVCTNIERTSRTIFVPKTASKLRTISMEPCSLQYIQQGVMYELYDFIDRHPYLGCRVRLRDQGQNQVLALEGSKYCTYSTVDLSHASDSVSWNLVRSVFRSTPRLYKWLVATRSTRTLLPTGVVHRLEKYAPMGSALCFPIECILFAAMAEYALGQCCTCRKSDFPIYSVYGDDIVIPTKAVGVLVRVLRLCGFTVNTRKTCLTGIYKESCGKEYLGGSDITPLYYRTPFYSGHVSPSAYGSWCGSANNALLHRLPIYRRHLISKILSVFRRSGPYFGYSPEQSPVLYSPAPTNFHVKARWNHDYQRSEGKFVSVKSRPRSGLATDDTLAYFCKLVELAKRPLNERPHATDEEPFPFAPHGCVEFFSSTTAPITPRCQHSMLKAQDWDGT
jgi:hypothetical protein